MGAVIEQQVREVSGRAAKAPVRVAIVGATGYVGRELVAILARHPGVRLKALMSSKHPGREQILLSDAHPVLRTVSELTVRPLDAEELAPPEAEIVFLATPHEVSHDLAPRLVERGLRVIDLSGAFRLKDAAAYPRWYGFEHREPAALAQAVYGLPELNAEAIRTARLVANPGCYATSIILALAPLLKAEVVNATSGIICDAKSGASGAGRSAKDELLFANVNENCRAYGLFRHRHVPESLQALQLAEESFIFTPHLLPLTRGILSTIYVRLTRPLTSDEVREIFARSYASAPLVRIYEDGRLPEIRAVANTAYADLGFALDASGQRLVVVSALDNLGKGAASQAVENLNLMLGYPQDTALK